MFDVILSIIAIVIIGRWIANLEKNGSTLINAFREAHEEVEREQQFDLVTWSPNSHNK